MLCLKRKIGESIFIGGDIRIIVYEAFRGGVKLGIEAPLDLNIRRDNKEDHYAESDGVRH